MSHNIKVNVVGPPKSGKSKIVEIIRSATEGMGVLVSEANDKSSPTRRGDKAAPENKANNLTPEVARSEAAAGSVQRSCSALSDWSFAIQDDCKDKIQILIHEKGSPDNCIAMPLNLERLKNIQEACNRVISRLSDADA